MRKNILTLMLVFVVFALSAQESQNVSHGEVFLKNKASDNWFMSIAGGTNSYFGYGSKDADLIKNLGW